MDFKNLSLHPKVLKAIDALGYTVPTEIQAKALPKVARGFDIRASAQTGTGKTAAFMLPILSRLSIPSKKPGRGPRALILVPTRELAQQVALQAEKYGRYMDRLKTACVVGGVPYRVQMRKLTQPCDVLIATPGRLIDFMEQGKIDFSRLEVLVLDEADRMLDMGFAKPVESILKKTPQERQTLLFSATLGKEILALSDQFMNKPMEIKTQSEKKSMDTIDQRLYYTNDLGHKNRLLEHILANEESEHTIVFTATKRHADQLARELAQGGHKAAALHGDMTQGRRTRTLRQLKEGAIDILVATDVAARGIDVSTITHVINFDLPQSVEDYVHRIGRTGRAGRAGMALSFVSGREKSFLKQIEKYTGHDITVAQIEGLEPKFTAEPAKKSKLDRYRPKGGPQRRRESFRAQRASQRGSGPGQKTERGKPRQFARNRGR